MRRSGGAQHPRGYTLMEMAVALTVATLLLGALGSAVVIAASALPSEAGGVTETMVETSAALDRLAGDLERAVYAPAMGARAFGVVLPDRDADGAPEVVRYAWGGAGGNPLVHTEDGGGAQDVLADVNAFGVGYDVFVRSETYPGALVTYDAVVDSFPAIVGAGATQELDKQMAYAVSVTPTLPAGVTAWRPTGVEIFAGQDGAAALNSEDVAVRLHADDAGVPSMTILAEAIVSESELGATNAWFLVEWPDAPALDPGAAYHLVIGNTKNDVAGTLTLDQTGGGGLMKAGVTSAFWNGNGQAPTWVLSPSEEYLFRLHGEYELQDPDIGVKRRFVARFTLDVTTGGDPAVTLASAARAPNAPEALETFWDADFSSDPTLLDLNADGTLDWGVVGGEFDGRTIDAGVWAVNAELRALPAKEFTRATIVDLDWRCTMTGMLGAYFFIAADHAAGEQCVLQLWIRRAGAATQRVVLSYVDDAGGTEQIADVTLDTTDMIATRLVIDPDSDSVVLHVGGAWVGTYRYDTRPYSASEHRTRIVPLGAGVEIDRARVRMGVAP